MEEYISQFAEELSGALSQNLGAAELEKLAPALPDLLKEFAYRIILDDSTAESRNLMHITHKYHRSIIQQVRENFSDACEQVEDKRLAQDEVMSLADKIPLLWGKEQADFPEEAHEDGAEGDDEEEDDTEDPEIPVISIYRDILFNSSAYRWLVSRIRGEAKLQVPGGNVIKDVIRNTILQTLGRPKRISRKTPQIIHTIVVLVEWDPFEFHRKQQYKEPLHLVLEDAITITGWGNNVQAATCLQYMTQLWPTTGPSFLRILQKMVKDPVNRHTATLPNKAIVEVGYVDGGVRIAISGSAYYIAEVVEQIAWLGSALRSSPLDQGIVYCQASLTDFRLNAANCPTSVCIREYTINFDISTSKDDENTTVAADCWHNLFRNPVVVSGYPILRRPKPDSGLDIPLGIMAPLVNSNTLVDFNGRTFVKGFSAMLAAAEVVGGYVFWHLLFNKNGEYISYADSRVPLVSHQTPRTSDSTATELTSLVQGAPDANYDLGWSGLPDPNQSCAFQNVSVSGGKFVNAGFNLAIGIKDKPAHIKFAPDDHIGTLRTLSRRQFVFYDVDEARAWLVDGTSALLHLLRAAIEDYQGDPDLERLGLLLFDANEIEEARKTHTGRDAAFEFLANENNLAIPLYLRATEAWTEKTTKLGSRESEEVLKEKSTAFRVKDRVDQIVRFLEQIIAHQDNVHTQAGVGFRLRHTPRRQLEGFDFMDVATNSDTIWPKQDWKRLGRFYQGYPRRYPIRYTFR
ncbi:hypothetical protein ColLi_11447 [Colletotrichum liriopes]|uniref:Pfs domain-containing protein n=1 Tax=Colletotrichum liriopes TaxID=708192 RepID=A0AA37GXB6_9PEZI|nr:hypothetical protein ColLi_11447 [Colletotrichum liriopes]